MRRQLKVVLVVLVAGAIGVFAVRWWYRVWPTAQMADGGTPDLAVREVAGSGELALTTLLRRSKSGEWYITCYVYAVRGNVLVESDIFAVSVSIEVDSRWSEEVVPGGMCEVPHPTSLGPAKYVLLRSDDGVRAAKDLRAGRPLAVFPSVREAKWLSRRVSLEGMQGAIRSDGTIKVGVAMYVLDPKSWERRFIELENDVQIGDVANYYGEN